MFSNFKKRLFLNIGASLAVFAVLGVAMSLLGIDSKKNSDYIAEVNSGITDRRRAASDLARLKSQAEVAEPILNELISKIPNRDSLFAFSVYVKSLADKYNSTSSLKFGEETKGDKFNNIRFSLNVQGDYSSVIRFLNDFESVPYFVNVLSFSIIRQGDRYSVVIDGNIMFRE